jgi:23S rRNA-/tRNA-specific pseudouridylate synthase
VALLAKKRILTNFWHTARQLLKALVIPKQQTLTRHQELLVPSAEAPEPCCAERAFQKQRCTSIFKLIGYIMPATSILLSLTMTELTDLAVLTATNQPWQLLHQDEDLLVVHKPARLLTVPGRHPANRDCLISRVQAEFPSAQVVHRLDYDTSGIVLLPLHKNALSALSKQFQARTISKQYHALVTGQTPLSGEIDLPIGPDEANRPLYKICLEQPRRYISV